MTASIFRTVGRLAAAGAVALLLAAAPVFGAPSAWAQGQAQPSHKAFVLIEYQVLDRPLFQKLRDEVRASLKDYKGDLVTREKVQPIFGSTPTNLSVISFPSIADARTWLGSKEMMALGAQRDKAATVNTYLVEKLD